MTPATFCAWLDEMKSAGLAKSDAAAARLLGVHVNTVLQYKARGGSQTLALACTALLHRMQPYS